MYFHLMHVENYLVVKTLELNGNVLDADVTQCAIGFRLH